jgi:hypothetical protein
VNNMHTTGVYSSSENERLSRLCAKLLWTLGLLYVCFSRARHETMEVLGHFTSHQATELARVESGVNCRVLVSRLGLSLTSSFLHDSQGGPELTYMGNKKQPSGFCTVLDQRQL